MGLRSPVRVKDVLVEMRTVSTAYLSTEDDSRVPEGVIRVELEPTIGDGTG